MEKNTMGAFIAVLRKANGMTQKQLAELLNVSDKAISRWERDEAMPDLTQIPVLAELFHVTADELLRGQRISLDAPASTPERTGKRMTYLVGKTVRRHQVSTLFAIFLAAAGLLAGAIGNFVFLQPVYGFWAGCIPFLAALATLCISQAVAKAQLKVEDFDAPLLSKANQKLRSITFGGYSVFSLLFSLSLGLLQYIPDAQNDFMSEFHAVPLEQLLKPWFMVLKDHIYFPLPAPFLFAVFGIFVGWIIKHHWDCRSHYGLREILQLAIVTAAYLFGTYLLIAPQIPYRHAILSTLALLDIPQALPLAILLACLAGIAYLSVSKRVHD